MKDSKGLQAAIAYLKGEQIIKTQQEVVDKTGYSKGTVEMVDKHYDIKSKKRKQEAVKGMGNKFS